MGCWAPHAKPNAVFAALFPVPSKNTPMRRAILVVALATRGPLSMSVWRCGGTAGLDVARVRRALTGAGRQTFGMM
jgi:hypothetical protein